MNTNFNFLDNILKELNGDNLDTKRYLRDIIFLFKKTEEKIYIRNSNEAVYYLRLCSDSIKEFLCYLIQNTNELIMEKWNKNIIKKNNLDNGKWKSSEEWIGYGKIFNSYPDNTESNIYRNMNIEMIKNTINELNVWMHYNYDTNYKNENNGFNNNDKSTLYEHRGEIRFRKPKFIDIINYLDTLYGILIFVMDLSKKFNFSKEKISFDESIYKETKHSINLFQENIHIWKLMNKKNKCIFCNKETLYIEPKHDSKFPFEYGPYIVCKNKKCEGKIDWTLKQKNILENQECPNCKEKTIQQRFNLRDEKPILYKACKDCDWNDK